jgi:hypothetical protein
MYKLEKHWMFGIVETFIREKNTKVETGWIVIIIIDQDLFLICLLGFFTHNPLISCITKVVSNICIRIRSSQENLVFKQNYYTPSNTALCGPAVQIALQCCLSPFYTVHGFTVLPNPHIYCVVLPLYK